MIVAIVLGILIEVVAGGVMLVASVRPAKAAH